MISTIVNLLYMNSQLFIYFDCKICFHNTNRVLFPRRTKIDVQTPTTMSLSAFGIVSALNDCITLFQWAESEGCSV